MKARHKRQRRKGAATPKGRQLDEAALIQVRALLGDKSLRRDLLIEHLHLLQDRFGHLSARHLHALAEEMKLSQAEVFEVASFYAHFDIVKEGETPPPALTIRICNSLPCAIRQAEKLFADLSAAVSNSQDIRVIKVPCVGRCAEAPVAIAGKFPIGQADVESILTVIDSRQLAPDEPVFEHLDSYRSTGGYSVLEACLSGLHAVDYIVDKLEKAGLRGLGGAGFPTAKKWQIVQSFDSPCLMTINADEGEPGTFKDRHYLETNPHKMLEGALIAAWAVGAERCYLYLRDEYPAAYNILKQEIAALDASGLNQHCPIELRRGAGAYICGEESAMLESIEGKRGLPRNRPPYIAQAGLFGRPTLNHNVETLYWIPEILGLDDAAIGAWNKRTYSVSGRVKNPGVVIAPAGTSVNQLIEMSGGMADGHRFKAFLPGGASGGILPAENGDLPLDFGTLEPHGCFIGSHAVIVLSDQDDMNFAATNLLEFFAEESCGQCTPCRKGCEKAVALMHEPQWDTHLLEELCTLMADASICGLGQAAPNPIRSVIKHFADEIT